MFHPCSLEAQMDWLNVSVMGTVLLSLFLAACGLFTLPLRLVIDDDRRQWRVALLFVSGVAVLVAVVLVSEEFFSGIGTPLWGLHMSVAQKILLCTILPAGAVLGLFLILAARDEFNIGANARMNKIAVKADAEVRRAEREAETTEEEY